MLTALLLPSVVVGYGFSAVSIRLVRFPWLNEMVYGGVLLGRYAVICMGVMMIGGKGRGFGSVSAGRYGATLAGLDVGWWSRLKWWCSGWIDRAVVGWLLVFVLVFGEFEIASLMGRPAWTVWLFDAQVGGASAGSVGKQMMWVVLGEIALLATAGAWFVHRNKQRGDVGLEAESGEIYSAIRQDRSWLGKLIAGVGLLGVMFSAGLVGWTGWFVIRSAVGGMKRFVVDGRFWGEIGRSGLYAGLSTIIVIGLLLLIQRRGGLRGLRWGMFGLMGLLGGVGLFGGLGVGLVVVRIFQTGVMRGLYDSAAPIVVGQVMVLLPMGWLLLLLKQRQGEKQGAHLAKLMMGARDAASQQAGRGLWWQMRGRAMYWAIGYVFVLGFFELSASAVLYPAGGMPASVRLYNLMHYGESDLLSAMVVGSLFVCLVCVIVGRYITSGGYAVVMRVMGWWAMKGGG